MTNRYLLALAVLTASLAPGLPAAGAGSCVAEADPPRSGIAVTARGRFACLQPASGMTVTVCLESLGGRRSPWVGVACRTTTSATPTSVVEGFAPGCSNALLYRTSVYGSNAAGETADATSIAVPAFCWYE